MTIVKVKKKAVIDRDLSGLEIDPLLLEPGWHTLIEDALPEYGGSFEYRNGYEVMTEGLKRELRRIEYSCLLFRWPEPNPNSVIPLVNKYTFVFVKRGDRVKVNQMCVFNLPPEYASVFLAFYGECQIVEVCQTDWYKTGLGWYLRSYSGISHHPPQNPRDVTQLNKFVMDPERDPVRMKFMKNLPILQFLEPTYVKPKKRPKIKRPKVKRTKRNLDS